MQTGQSGSFNLLSCHSKAAAWRVALLAVCVAALAACGQAGHRQAPSYTLELANGTRISSQSLAGKAVVLSFWATWCGPCREELPALQHLYATHYADRDDVRFFLVNEDRGPGAAAKAAAWLQRHDVSLPSVLDPDGTLGRKFSAVNVLPSRIVIGPRGKVLLKTWGYSKEDAGFPDLRHAISNSLD